MKSLPVHWEKWLLSSAQHLWGHTWLSFHFRCWAQEKKCPCVDINMKISSLAFLHANDGLQCFSYPFSWYYGLKIRIKKKILFLLLLKIRIGPDLSKLAAVNRFIPFGELWRLDGTNQAAATCQAIIWLKTTYLSNFFSLYTLSEVKTGP